jgi:hypothetical protein
MRFMSEVEQASMAAESRDDGRSAETNISEIVLRFCGVLQVPSGTGVLSRLSCVKSFTGSCGLCRGHRVQAFYRDNFPSIHSQPPEACAVVISGTAGALLRY